METKILNKKVGCALIAASLLAASSVQGSQDSNVRDAETFIQYDTVRITLEKGIRFYYPVDYRLTVEERNAEIKLQVSLVGTNSNVSLEDIMERNVPGFHLYSVEFDGVKVKIFVPNGFAPAVLPNEGIVLFPQTVDSED
jgi:hypothetical protein